MGGWGVDEGSGHSTFFSRQILQFFQIYDKNTGIKSGVISKDLKRSHKTGQKFHKSYNNDM